MHDAGVGLSLTANDACRSYRRSRSSCGLAVALQKRPNFVAHIT